MSTTRVDLGTPQPGGAKPSAMPAPGKKERKKKSLSTLPFRLARAVAFLVTLALLPFFLLIRGGVFAYQEWGLGTWPALLSATGATALLLALYAWAAGRRVGAGKGVRKAVGRAASLTALAAVVYALVYVGGANVKSPEVRAEYTSLHPLLRVAASAVILVDPASVVTDAGRTPDFYARMGLPPNEASLHFMQDDGFVHALDLRTKGRPEWRNKAVELAFWALGFHSLRHTGTADHLHVSLRLPH